MMLITATLLNAFRWYSHYYGEEPEDETLAREDFLRMLAREPISDNLVSEAILKGRALETNVFTYCDNPYTGAPGYIEEIGQRCMGGMRQVVVQSELDGKYLLYGRVDQMRANIIRDIKYCAFYDTGKYIRSAQHRIYLYCSGMPRFDYEVTNERDVWVETYYNHDAMGDEIRGLVWDFTQYLKGDPQALELFNTHWRAKP